MVTSGYQWSYSITGNCFKTSFMWFSMTGKYLVMKEEVIYLMAVVIVSVYTAVWKHRKVLSTVSIFWHLQLVVITKSLSFSNSLVTSWLSQTALNWHILIFSSFFAAYNQSWLPENNPPVCKGVFNQLSQPSNFFARAAEIFLGMTKGGLEARTR